MNKLILATAAAVLLGAPLASAATTTTTNTMPTKPAKTHLAATSLADRCTALGERFDKEEATHKTAANYKDAVALRSEGQHLCASNKQAAGVKYLQSAIKVLDAKPKI
jgi:hypothetical protein